MLVYLILLISLLVLISADPGGLEKMEKSPSIVSWVIESAALALDHY